MQVKALLSAEPYGKQADKRKKEVAELEMKVWYKSICIIMLQFYVQALCILAASLIVT